MLFRLQMDITTAIDAYNKLTSRVESAPSAGVVNTREGSRASRLGLCFEAIIKKHKGADLQPVMWIILTDANCRES